MTRHGTRTARLAHGYFNAAIARNHGKSAAQVILRWNLQHGVVPLPKAMRAEHQRGNLDLFDFELDDLEMATLDALNEHFSALGKLDYV
jgi:diketogulonate reductase-like aldo/keto reductase